MIIDFHTHTFPDDLVPRSLRYTFFTPEIDYCSFLHLSCFV